MVSHHLHAGDEEAAKKAVLQAQSDEATQEILKQLSFPEIEKTSKVPQMAPKVCKCLQKRISKLNDCLQKFSGELNANQATRPVLAFWGW